MSEIEKHGYCEVCAENTSFRLVSVKPWRSPGYWITSLIGIGPWYCAQCSVQQWKIHKVLSTSSVGAPENASVSVGNFIRGDSNLVMQSTRSSRYSDKFRAGIVQRVLEGKQSLAQIADELDVPQADVLVWVAQQFDQKQQQIDQLKREVEHLREVNPEQFRLVDRSARDRSVTQPDQLSDSNDVVEGQVR